MKRRKKDPHAELVAWANGLRADSLVTSSSATDPCENGGLRADQRQCRHLKVTGEVNPDGKVIRETCDDCEAVLPPFTPAASPT